MSTVVVPSAGIKVDVPRSYTIVGDKQHFYLIDQVAKRNSTLGRYLTRPGTPEFAAFIFPSYDDSTPDGAELLIGSYRLPHAMSGDELSRYLLGELQLPIMVGGACRLPAGDAAELDYFLRQSGLALTYSEYDVPHGDIAFFIRMVTTRRQCERYRPVLDQVAASFTIT